MEKRLPVRSRIVVHAWAVVDRLTRELDRGMLEWNYSEAKIAAVKRNQGRRRVALPDGKTVDRFAVVRVRLEYDFARRYMAARGPVDRPASKFERPSSDTVQPVADGQSVPMSKPGVASSDIKQAG